MEPNSKSAEWHTMGVAQVCAALDVEPKRGLSDAEVQRRRAMYGDNVIAEQRRRSLLRLFISQFTDFMIVVLIVAAVIAGAVGEIIDSLAIIVIVLLNGERRVLRLRPGL